MSLFFVNHSQETFTPTQSGAIATVLWELCRAAQRYGVEPIVISRSAPVPAFAWPKFVGIEYPAIRQGRLSTFLYRAERRVTGWPYLRQRSYAARVAEAIVKVDSACPTIVLNNDPEMAIFLRNAFPTAWIIHVFHNQHGCKDFFRRQFRNAVDRVVAVSDFTSSWIASYYGVAGRPVRTIYNGVDLQQFQPSAMPRSGLPTINFVGRTGIEKGPDILLDAALRLAERRRNFTLQILGANHWDRFELDDYQRSLDERVARLERLGIAVRRPGHVDRATLPSELRKASIHVVPARWDEPFGLTTLEGMACGLATVASRTGGTPEVLGDAGILFERERADELAAVLERLLGDEVLCTDYRRRARRRAEEFTWDRAWVSLAQSINCKDVDGQEAVTPMTRAGSPCTFVL